MEDKKFIRDKILPKILKGEFIHCSFCINWRNNDTKTCGIRNFNRKGSWN